MEIVFDLQNTTLAVSVTGRINSSNAKTFEEQLLQQIDGGGTRVVLDFAGCDFIDSSGIRVLLVAAKRLLPAQGRIVLFGLNRHIKTVFEIAGLSSVFPICASRDEAMAAVALPAPS